MLLLDLLRPYLVRHSLYNTLLVTLLALPLTLLLGYVVRGYAARGISHTLSIQTRWPRLLPLAIGVPPLLAIWLVPQLAQATAYLRSEPTTMRMLRLSLLLTLWIFPIVVCFMARAERLVSESSQPKQKRWQQLVSTAVLCICLLMTNIGAAILLTGGMPFNATHTLASWLFQMIWVNGDLISGFAIGGLLASGLLGAVGGIDYIQHRALQRTMPRAFAIGLTPLLLVGIPWVSRTLGLIDGRWPLLLCDSLSAAWIVCWMGGVWGEE